MTNSFSRTCKRAAMVLLLSAASTLSAQGILNLDMSNVGIGGSSGLPVTSTTTIDPNLSLTQGLQLGPGLELGGNGQQAEQISTLDYSTGATLDGAIVAEDYMTFSIAVGSSYTLDLQSITFDIRRNGGAAASDYAILSSITGFTANDALGTLNTSATTIESVTANTASLADYGTIAGGTTVEFRLYGWNANSEFANTHITDAILTGTLTPVPEPSAYALLAGLLSAGVLLWRKRK